MTVLVTGSFFIACALVSIYTSAAQLTYPDPAARCCALLQLSHQNATYFLGSENYQSSINSYWSSRARLNPACIIAPASALEVSQVTVTLVNNSCPFAIRSGGHNPFPDNNINSTGITIDLSRLSTIALQNSFFSNGKVATIGPGARWGNVYDYLAPYGLAVSGGRAASVGVGGLVLGGGNSFFAARYGFACDSVENFQVVLANGSIVDANSHTNADLWQVLKGGSSNFGIVTRIDLTVIDLPGGEIWGGVILYPDTTIPAQVSAFVEFNNKIETDPAASLIAFWVYSSETNTTIVKNCYEYTSNTAALNDAPIFHNLLGIKPEIPKTNTVRKANLTSLTTELEPNFDVRDLFSTLTFANDEETIRAVYNISQLLLDELRTVKGLTWVTMFQPLPTIFSKHSVERGRNIIGLDRAQRNQVLFLLFVQWEDPADDKVLNEAASTLMWQVTQLTRSTRMANEWIYLNYALEKQNVLAGYGTDNVKKMYDASKKYDPQGVFQTLVPGGFKIPGLGAPAPISDAPEASS